MQKICFGLAVFVVCLTQSVVSRGQDDPLTPQEQYSALLKEYNIATGSGVPLTDEERMKFIGRVYRQHFAVSQQFLELAEKYPTEPVALDALMQAVWQVNTTPWPVEMVGEDISRAKAFELIQRDHIDSDRLGPLCRRISYGFCEEYETFLRAVLANNPHREIKATACLSLAHFLYGRRQRVDLCQDDATLASEFAALYGRDYLTRLVRQNRDQINTEVEIILNEAVETYGDVKITDEKTVADLASTALFGLRNLSVGKKAPDIEGEDQDGIPFRLSDYRGRVVLLDFWSYV